jgi:hypothetical protein
MRPVSESIETRKLTDHVGALVPAAGEVVSLLERIAEQRQPLDRLLTIDQARKEYGLSASAARRLSFVSDRRRVVKLSAVQSYIRAL